MKWPKTLIICGKKRHITYKPDDEGGLCDLVTGNITIGTATKEDVLETLMHEVGELILHTHGDRYSRYVEGNDGLRFVMDHRGYEAFIRELTLVVEQLKS